MICNLVHITINNISRLHSHTKETLEEDSELGCSPENDLIEIPTFLLHLQHDIYQTGQLAFMLTCCLHDIQADGGNPAYQVLIGRPGIGSILVEHSSCYQLHRIVVDLFLVLEILIDGRTGNATLCGYQREVGITIAFSCKDFQCSL